MSSYSTRNFTNKQELRQAYDDLNKFRLFTVNLLAL